MSKINQTFKTESILRAIIAILGILTFNISTNFGWGFILGELISKEQIRLNSKEGLGLLALITGVMIVALYFLIDVNAVYGYVCSTIVYFIIRFIIQKYIN